MLRLRRIWAEGCFSALKREHLMAKIRKWGVQRAHEECLLSALALNLKRMLAALGRRRLRQPLLCFLLSTSPLIA